jgi:hypothetical protein
MDRSSPRSFCHFLTEVQPWWAGTLSKISKSRVTRWGGLNGHLQGVHDPSQDVLPGRPCCVALLHLFNGRWLLAERTIARAEAPKHRVEGDQECALDVLAVMWPALDQTNEVVGIDISLFNRDGPTTRVALMGWYG